MPVQHSPHPHEPRRALPSTANQNYSVVQNRYQNDLALLTDMVDASNMKLSAEMALVNARISMLYNFYTLKYVTNTL